MNRLVIANWGRGDQGKSASVRSVFNLLSKKYPTRVLLDDGDIKAIVRIGDYKVGIESQGDPKSRILQSIDDFVSEGCVIIVCACRSWGETTNKVASLKKKGYDIIWAQNDKSDNTLLHSELNELYAERVVIMIDRFISDIH